MKVLVNNQNKVITYKGLAVLKPTIVPTPQLSSYGNRVIVTFYEHDEVAGSTITVNATLKCTVNMDLSASNNSLVIMTMQAGYNFVTWPTGTYSINGNGSYPVHYEANSQVQTYIDFNNAAKSTGDVLEANFTYTVRKVA